MEIGFAYLLVGKKKERNFVEILPPRGYAQQEVHPCPLDYKGRYVVARLPRSRPLNMIYGRTLYA